MKKKLKVVAIIALSILALWISLGGKEHSGSHTYSLYRHGIFDDSKIVIATFNVSGENIHWNLEHCYYALEGIKPHHKAKLECVKE
jgi:hypothetical protein